MDVLNGGSLIMGGIPDPLSVNQIQAKSGPLKIGSATSGHGLTATDDTLIAGKLEVDGYAFFDGGAAVYNPANTYFVVQGEAGSRLIDFRNSSNQRLVTIDSAGSSGIAFNQGNVQMENLALEAQKTLTMGVFTDAQRPAAGTAGRVIYNSTDGNLNIDDGTNWILPDGTIT